MNRFLCLRIAQAEVKYVAQISNFLDFMQNTLNKTSTCKHCSFAPFCSPNTNIKGPTAVIDHHHHVKRKTHLCLTKKKPQHLYVIREGAIKAFRIDANGKEMIKGFYFTGEVFGYDSIYTGHYLCSAEALIDTTICQVSYDSLLQLLQMSPELQKYLLQLISAQLSIGSYLISQSAEQRLAAFLIDMSNRLTKANENNFVLPISRQDIGNYLGLTQETVSRIFSSWKKNHLIAIEQKRMRILAQQKLHDIAN